VKGPDHSIERDGEGFHPIVTWPLGTDYVQKESRITSVGDSARIVWVSIDL
jgi:hypothetical protein